MIYTILICLFSFSSQAEWQTQGEAKSFYSAPKKPPSNSISGQNGGVFLDSNSLYKRGFFRTRLHPQFKADFLTLDEKYEFEPREAFAEVKLQSHRLRIGYQTFAWAGTDFLNLMDVMHTKNWREPLNPSSRASAAVSYYYEQPSWTFELAYVPRQSSTILPGNKSAWWPRRLRLPVEDYQLVVNVPENIEYNVSSSETFNSALDHQLGTRLDYHHSKFDAAITGFEGAASDPLVFADLNLTLQPGTTNQYTAQSPLTLRPYEYRHRVVAGILTVPSDTWIFRLSSRYQQSLGTDTRLPGWSRSTVFGLEKTIWRAILAFNYIETIQAHNSRLAFLRSIYERAVGIGLRLPVTDEFTWITGFVYDLRGASSFLRSAANYSFTNHWSGSLQIDLFQGPSETLLGAYDEADRGTISVSYNY